VSSLSVGSFVRRHWTVVVTVIVVAIVAFTVYRLHGTFGSNNAVTRPSADALENTGYNPKQVLFEVFGSPGSVATINYLDEHAQPQRGDQSTQPEMTPELRNAHKQSNRRASCFSEQNPTSRPTRALDPAQLAHPI